MVFKQNCVDYIEFTSFLINRYIFTYFATVELKSLKPLLLRFRFLTALNTVKKNKRKYCFARVYSKISWQSFYFYVFATWLPLGLVDLSGCGL